MRELLYGATSGASTRVSSRGRRPPPRRRHPRRQPALGQGDAATSTPRTATGPAPTRSTSSSAGATRSASRSSRCGCCRPTTSTGRRPSSTRCSRIIEDARHRPRRRPAAGGSTRSARSTCCPAQTAAVLKEAEDAHARPYGGLHGQRRRRLRRSARDRRRGALAAAGARAARGTSIEELAEILDVEHIAEHLYTKGQPDPDLVIRTVGRAAAVRASCSGRARTRSSTSARPSGRTSARSTSCAPCARTAARPPLRRLSLSDWIVVRAAARVRPPLASRARGVAHLPGRGGPAAVGVRRVGHVERRRRDWPSGATAGRRGRVRRDDTPGGRRRRAHARWRTASGRHSGVPGRAGGDRR